MQGAEGSDDARGLARAREAARAFVPPVGGDPRLPAVLARAAVRQPVRVERLDRSGAAYYLVPFYEGDDLRAIVEVNASGASVAKAGVVSGDGVTFVLDPEAALAAARGLLPELSNPEEPRLGWRPCRESLDSFLPLWIIDHAGGRVYVDQSGRAHHRLTIPGPG